MTATEPRASQLASRPGTGDARDSGESSRPVGFRADIDGLRAVAIILVVAYHAGIPGFAGGFIGVDVFFVISGFLIMTQLDRELVARGTVRLRTFWARRARRLVPAAAVTTLFVVIASQFAFSALRWQPVAVQGLATTFYLSNELFRRASTDYFAPSILSSPLLNTWSLAVEEQFYLVWPMLLVLVAAVFPRPGVAGRRVRVIAVATVSVLSFAFSQRALQVDQPTAYFAALSRAWEFGVGALLALLAGYLRTWSTRRTRTAAVLGVVVLVWAMATISDLTAYPGSAAVLPVLAAAGIIIAGAGRDLLPARTLGCAPLQAIGRLSYSWYLWHWPVMVIGTAWLSNQSVGLRTTLVLVSLVPAFLTYRYLETVLRRAPSLVASNKRTAAVMLTFVAVVATCCCLLWVRGSVAVSDPYVQRLVDARADSPALPGECATNDVDQLLASCQRGDPLGTTTVLLVGDSHAAHWLPAFDEAGKANHFRVVASMMGVCPSVSDGYRGEAAECATKIAGVPTLLSQLHPDLVVLANSVGYLDTVYGPDGQVAADPVLAWQQGVTDRAEELRRLGIPLLIIQDTPGTLADPNECLAKQRDDAACESTIDEQLQTLAPMRQAEAGGVAAAGWGTLWDPLPLLCPNGTCELEDHGRLVYTDEHHLTNTESRALQAPIADAVRRALDRTPTS
jgi:peptidoglycan/LPS O-acetylase OafA/YrhL